MKRHFGRILMMLGLTSLSIQHLSSQPGMITFEKMGMNGSLPDASVIFQDSDENIWLGSFDGLYSYDGNKYTSFRHDPDDRTSISGNRITCIEEDSDGRLWIGTFGYGLNYSDTLKRTFTAVDLGADAATGEYPKVLDLLCDDDRNIWISTDLGMIILRETQPGSFTTISISDVTNRAAPEAAILQNSRIFYDASRRIWIAPDKGLYMFDTKKKKWFGPAAFTEVAERVVHDIESDTSGRIWISSSGQTRLWHLDERDMVFLPYDQIKFAHDKHAINFCFDSDNRIWASEFGDALWGYDPQSEELFLNSSRNSNARYMRFWRMPFTDATGNVWICGDGVFMYPYPEGFQHYAYHINGDNSVSTIFSDTRYMWVAIRETGLVRVDLHTNDTKLFSTRDGLHSNLTYSICTPDPELTVLGMFGAIQFLRNDKIIFTARVGGAIRSMLPESNGIVWAAGNSGLFKIDVNRRAVLSVDLAASLGRGSNYLQTMTWAGPNEIWIASESQGLILFDTESEEAIQFTPHDSLNPIPSWRIIDLAIDAQETLWLGTDLGLVKFNTRDYSSRLYNRNDGIEQDFIASVIYDSSSGIWVSTNSGISHLDPTCDSFVNYNSSDGLANSFYYPRARFLSKNGDIFFGGRNGVDFFNPEQLRSNPFPPKLSITSFQASGTEMLSSSKSDLSAGLRFDHNTGFIRIEFKSQYYSAPESVTYQYRIDGLNSEWRDLGNRNEITLTGLKPDHYTVHIRAESPDGVRDPDDLIIPITITPPFWETLVFRILSIVLICAIILLFVNKREKTITRKEREESELRQKMLDLEKKALLAQMNPHFIFNAMNSIQEYIFDGDNEGAMRYLTKFSRLLRRVIQASSHQHIALNSEIQLISDYIELEQMRFPGKFDYIIEVDPGVDINSVEISPFIIQPQVENAILHGIMNKTGKGRIKIRVEIADARHLKITVEDNGIGRKRAAELSLSNKFKHIGRATTIVKQRLMHNEDINGRKPFETEDLYDGEGAPSGTRIHMLISKH